ncbi:class A beta-lactamase-related serine hydrolase [Bremerella cremea]|uniref:Serine hydrolase n=2 Tax=Pirellulales TaxID=2691354 RepID=A0A2S8FYV9_9BACT|nr:serine hydrolase [Blastopirellula marina]RCS49760.1 class A beta-lactamase-related serine hydrolase [Bremerella cremea]
MTDWPGAFDGEFALHPLASHISSEATSLGGNIMMARWTRRQWLAAAGSLALTPAVFADAATDSTRLLLETEFKKHGLQALLCGVWRGEENVSTTVLGNSMTGVPATADMHFRVGGVTLTSVCVLLLQFVDRGLVKLDDPLSKWFPNLPKADQVTLQMLGNSTSGYADYVPAESFQKASEADPFRQWTAQELIAIGMESPMLYAPGQGWNYAHTNFVILGEVLKKVGGKSMAALLNENLIRPLGLQQTKYITTPQIPSPVLHAFTAERGTYEESTFWNPSWTSHTGLMISTLGDLGVLANAIGKGTLLSEASRKELTAPTTVGLGINQPNLYYALGIGMMNGWLVQNPRFGGYNLIFAYLPAKQLSVVISTTMGPKCSPDVAYATTVFKELVKELTPDTLIPDVVK